MKAVLLNKLIDSLRNDVGAWTMGGHNNDCRLIHRSGLSLWVWWGAAYVYKPDRIDFGFWGKKRLRSAFRHWRRVHGRGLEKLREAAAVSKCLAMLRQS